MNRYQSLMEQCEPPDGFRDRLSAGMLSAAGGKHRVYRPRPALRTVILYAVIAFALAASAGAVWLAVNWDPVFLARFSPSEPAKAQMEHAVQDVNVSSQCGDVTLTVRQAMGDDKTIYAVLDLTLPETVSLSSYLKPGAADGAWDFDLCPEDLRFFAADASYADIAGMTFQQAADSLYAQRFYGGASWGVESMSADPETNTLTYLICFSTDSSIQTVTGQPLTVLMDRLVFWTGTGYETVLEGPFLLSWTPVYDGIVYTYDITDGDSVVGTLSLSALAMKVELYRSDYESFDAFGKTVGITFRDGTTCLPASSGVGGSFSSPSGAIHYRRFFRDILLLDDVVSVQAGGYQVKIQ